MKLPGKQVSKFKMKHLENYINVCHSFGLTFFFWWDQEMLVLEKIMNLKKRDEHYSAIIRENQILYNKIQDLKGTMHFSPPNQTLLPHDFFESFCFSR